MTCFIQTSQNFQTLSVDLGSPDKSQRKKLQNDWLIETPLHLRHSIVPKLVQQDEPPNRCTGHHQHKHSLEQVVIPCLGSPTVQALFLIIVRFQPYAATAITWQWSKYNYFGFLSYSACSTRLVSSWLHECALHQASISNTCKTKQKQLGSCNIVEDAVLCGFLPAPPQLQLASLAAWVAGTTEW